MCARGKIIGVGTKVKYALGGTAFKECVFQVSEFESRGDKLEVVCKLVSGEPKIGRSYPPSIVNSVKWIFAIDQLDLVEEDKK